jgi:hypothetical protein
LTLKGDLKMLRCEIFINSDIGTLSREITDYLKVNEIKKDDIVNVAQTNDEFNYVITIIYREVP